MTSPVVRYKDRWLSGLAGLGALNHGCCLSDPGTLSDFPDPKQRRGYEMPI
jgi:hypothetical protein